MKEKQRRKWSSAALFLAALIWGGTFFIVKNTVDAFPPNLLLAWRFSIAFLLLGAVFFSRWKKLNRGYLWRGALMGLFLFLAYSVQTIGIQYTTPGKSAFLTAVYCVMVPFLYWITDKKAPDVFNIISALLCILGIGLISLTDNFSIGFGDALTLLCGLFYALHIVVVAKFSQGRDIILLTVLQFGFSAVFSWIATLLFEEQPKAPGADAVWAVIFLAVVATTGGLLLQNLGQKHTHPSTASIILSLESVFGVLFSVLFYGEQMTAKLVVGFIFVFLAVIISETKLQFLRKKQDRDGEENAEEKKNPA